MKKVTILGLLLSLAVAASAQVLTTVPSTANGKGVGPVVHPVGPVARPVGPVTRPVGPATGPKK